MNRLQLALRRYQQIVPQVAKKPWDVPQRELKVWLKEDVNAVLDDFARRPRFREYSSWPIRTLRTGANTPERGIIDRLDADTRRCATAILALAGKRILRRAMDELYPPTPLASQPRAIGDVGVGTEAECGQFDETAMQLSQLSHLVRADQADLVNVNDYFEPEQEFVEVEPGRRIQRGEMIVSLNHELLPVGNFVVRCLYKRISLRMTLLKNVINKLHAGLRRVRPTYDTLRQELESAWVDARSSSTELDRRLRTGSDSRLVDSCVVTTQVYAAFHPAPEIDFLGLDPAVTQHGSFAIAARTRQFQNAEMFDRIATALNELGALYEGESTPLAPIDEAIARGGLVIDRARQRAYWEGDPISGLSPTSWRFLVALGRKAIRAATVDFRDVFDDAVTPSAISTACGRLKKQLPASLRRLIMPGPERGNYRLTLETNRIQIFE